MATSAELAPGAFTRVAKISPHGTLEMRKLAKDTRFYWRVKIGGKTLREMIGVYDSSAPPKSLKPTAKGYSIAAATRAAEALAEQHDANLNIGGLPGLRAKQAREKAEADAAQAQAEAAAQAQADAHSKFTLRNLLSEYCDHLKTLGRRSHTDARSIFNNHVPAALAAMPANEVELEQVADAMRTLAEAGKGRTANKLRSYMGAAYQVALLARSKASIPVAFKAYGVRHNPAGATAPDEAANKADKHPLSLAEMRSYWQAIRALPGQRGALLRLHLLTGGQRIEQLVNLLSANVSDDSIILSDGKGRPGKPPRPHTVPLTAPAKQALQDCGLSEPWALSTDGGKTHIAATTLSEWAVVAGAGIEGFEAKRIRSGVETVLAGAGVSQEHRGRLQSHGISGVQARHYDGHDYLGEKLAALETLHRLIEGKPTGQKVLPLRRKG